MGTIGTACQEGTETTRKMPHRFQVRKLAAAFSGDSSGPSFEQCSHYCELVSDPRTDPSCPGNQYSDCNLAPQRLCDRSYD
jgi:hypothetical protein